jgi:hypothetical protein
MNNGRVIAAYLLLVGGPLLGLVGILRAGTHLSAPSVVRGNWIAETNSDLWHNLQCETPLTNARQPLLNIVQSGRNLTITLNNPQKTILYGTIGGSRLLAVSALTRDKNGTALAAVAGCPDMSFLRLEARVNDQGKKRFLNGSISIPGCAECTQLAFSAIRQEANREPAR